MKNNLSIPLSRFVTKGFTLLEVLIALFIFTILSMILVGALRSVMDAHSRTEKNAERLRNLQFALLVLSRDIEQTVNRPVLNVSGKEDSALLGTSRSFVLTHTGYANLTGALTRSILVRTGYKWEEESFWRMTWDVLDQAPQSLPHLRKILNDVSSVSFKYLNQEGRFVDNWPMEGETNQTLPRAIQIQFMFSNWGKISQLYVIPVRTNKKN